MEGEKIRVEGVFIPAKTLYGVKYIILMAEDVLPLRDGQTVRLVVGDKEPHPSA
ncbi:MAG: hypothetical protein JW778_04655 [Candidatus Altiarchaeota archaeon]|nr:hypothetical protein [Candidatus Altiarchaeota archaeon]